MEDGRPALLIRAQPLEDVGVNPHAVAAPAFEQGCRADVHSTHRVRARGAGDWRFLVLRPFPPRPARRTESCPLEDLRKAGGTTDGGEAGVAVRAPRRLGVYRRSAVRTMQGGSVGHNCDYNTLNARGSALGSRIRVPDPESRVPDPESRVSDAFWRELYGPDGLHQGRVDRDHRVDRRLARHPVVPLPGR